MKDLQEMFPLCQEHNPELFEEVHHHVMVMEEVSNKMSIPLEELIEFFYKGKLKLECIQEQEEVLRKYVK